MLPLLSPSGSPGPRGKPCMACAWLCPRETGGLLPSALLSLILVYLNMVPPIHSSRIARRPVSSFPTGSKNHFIYFILHISFILKLNYEQNRRKQKVTNEPTGKLLYFHGLTVKSYSFPYCNMSNGQGSVDLFSLGPYLSL